MQVSVAKRPPATYRRKLFQQLRGFDSREGGTEGLSLTCVSVRLPARVFRKGSEHCGDQRALVHARNREIGLGAPTSQRVLEERIDCRLGSAAVDLFGKRIGMLNEIPDNQASFGAQKAAVWVKIGARKEGDEMRSTVLVVLQLAKDLDIDPV